MTNDIFRGAFLASACALASCTTDTASSGGASGASESIKMAEAAALQCANEAGISEQINLRMVVASGEAQFTVLPNENTTEAQVAAANACIAG